MGGSGDLAAAFELDENVPLEDVFQTWVPVITGIAFGVFAFHFKDTQSGS